MKKVIKSKIKRSAGEVTNIDLSNQISDLTKIVENLAISTHKAFSEQNKTFASKSDLIDVKKDMVVAFELTKSEILGAFKDESISSLSRYGKLNEKADQNYIELNKRLKKVESKVFEN